MIELVLKVHDPLARPQTLCRDALRVAADLEILLNRPRWQGIEDVVRRPRAWALLNLCAAVLDNETPFGEDRRRRIREIKPRVKLAAVAERDRRGSEIEQATKMREAAVPNLWNLLERYVNNDKARAARGRVC